VNQEQLHALAANGVLSTAGAQTQSPCQYNFPVENFIDAIALAQTLTDLVLGVLPGAQALFAADGGDETGLIPIVGSIIGQEGEQNGWFRVLQRKIPSAAPFLTGGAAQFAFTALNTLLAPGSCPDIGALNLTAFPLLTVESTPKAANSTLVLSVNSTAVAQNQSMSIAYISGQNLPVVVPVSGMSVEQDKTFFFAPFPFDEGFARSLTLGALVPSGGEFNSSAAVANATIAGPAIIEVN